MRAQYFLAFGAMVPTCERIAERLDATLVNMRFIKPLDEELVLKLASTHRAFVTVEENVVAGGAGSAIGECLAVQGVSMPMLSLGIPDRFIEHGRVCEFGPPLESRDLGLQVLLVAIDANSLDAGAIQKSLYFGGAAQFGDEDVDGCAIAIDDGAADQIAYGGAIAIRGDELGDGLHGEAEIGAASVAPSSRTSRST